MKSELDTFSSNASVISTGAGGTVFEHHMAASFLALLLSEAFLPVHTRAIATKVHFQAKRLGWNTDDLVIEGTDSSGQHRKLAVQVKRALSVSAADDDFRKTLLAAWTDFHNVGLFNRSSDALAFIVHLGTNRLIGDFRWLLTQARTSLSAEDFTLRRSGQGLLNKRSKTDCETIRKIISEEVQIAITDQELWPFLCSLHVLSYDLSDDSSKDEASVKTLLALLAIDGVPESSVSATWNELIATAGQAATTGRSFGRENLPATILQRHRRVASTEHAALIALRQHSEVVLNRVADSGPRGLEFPRFALAEQLSEAAAASQIVLVVGSAGSGKSVLAKRHIRSTSDKQFVFTFAAEEFRAPHIDKVLSDAQVGVNWASLRSLLSLQNQKTLLLEGLERLLESEDRGALIDLLHVLADDPTLRLVATCRDYHAETVERTMLRPSGVGYRRVVVPELSDEELDKAVQTLPALGAPLSSAPLRRLLRNPFMLARAAELPWPANQALPLTEKALRERLWGDVVRRDAYTHEALPQRRAAALTKIALNRACSLQPYVEQRNADDDAIQQLASDNLITFDSPSRQRAAPAHDVFEDWALIEWLSEEFATAAKEPIAFAQRLQPYPALRRAYRKWLCELIEFNASTATEYLLEVASARTLPDYLRDDTLIAVFQSSTVVAFLSEFGSTLLAEEARLLCRAIHLVRVACKTVSSLAPKSGSSAHQWHVPAGLAWKNLLDFVAENWDAIPASAHPLILGFVEDWASGINWKTPYPEGWEPVGVLLAKLFPNAKRGWHGEGDKQRILSLLLRAPKSAEPLFKDLVRRATSITDRREDSDAEQFVESLLKPFQSFAVCRDFPKDMIDLCLAIWKPKRSSEDGNYYSGFREVDSVFGIEVNHSQRFFPPSTLQGPFKHLLLFHPASGIRFIVALVNSTIEHYGQGRARLQYVEDPEQVTMTLPDGTKKQVWGNSRLWNAYRATSVMPDVLESALMALEAWALESIDYQDAEEPVRRWLDWILRNTNNVSLIAVVASICLAHPSKTREVGLTLIGCREFFNWDLQRMVAESGALAPGGLEPVMDLYFEGGYGT